MTTKTLRPYLSDAELEQLERFNPQYMQRHGRCPVCLDELVGNRRKDESEPVYYLYEGQEYECPDDSYGHIAIRLAKRYWLANIDLQYQQLIWDEYPHEHIRTEIDGYLDKFDRLSLNGVGLTIWSKDLGVGKTWAGTHVLRERVKQGTDCWFVNFFEMASYYQMRDEAKRDFLLDRVQNVELLMLDEVKLPKSEAQALFFADQLEDLLRPRTNANLPTIVTTNMTPEEWKSDFPRVYSLLMAKNNSLHVQGSDARIGSAVWKSNFELAVDGEARPIT